MGTTTEEQASFKFGIGQSVIVRDPRSRHYGHKAEITGSFRWQGVVTYWVHIDNGICVSFHEEALKDGS